jgi:hypothetical protein
VANPDTIALAARAETEGLEAVLVGGNAVNLHAYSRTTFDVDLLVREADAERWLVFQAADSVNSRAKSSENCELDSRATSAQKRRL